MTQTGTNLQYYWIQILQRYYIIIHYFNIDQFKIISDGRTDVECKIKEALNMKNVNPTLNQNLFQHGSSFLINVFK